jgi:hypothetical protein
MRYQHYIDHEFRPYDGCAFGPDIEWGVALRQKGYRNYLDWSVAMEHCRPDGTSVRVGATPPAIMRFEYSSDNWVGEMDGQQ